MAADTTRPITGNSEWDIDNRDTLTNVMDVMTCSYNYDLYSLYHYTHPNKPIMGGESDSCTTDRGYYKPSNATTGHVYAGDDGCVVQGWKSAAVNAWDSGNFIWTGHDYKGEPTPFDWPCINSHFGILDIAGFEKDSTGYYRSWWLPSGSKYLKLVPGDWNSPVDVGAPIVLRAYTGAAAVEAFINGVSLGRQTVEVWGVTSWPARPFQRGNISAVAYDANGNVVATALVATTGSPDALRVTLVDDGAARPSFAADGADVALFTVEVIDKQGAVVTDACVPLVFSVKGPGSVYGVGNGDPSDLTPDKVGHPDLPYGGVWKRSSFMGLARAIVQTQAKTPGSITLVVSSPGLQPGAASFTSQ
jgi:beta-galactosidase